MHLDFTPNILSLSSLFATSKQKHQGGQALQDGIYVNRSEVPTCGCFMAAAPPTWRIIPRPDVPLEEDRING